VNAVEVVGLTKHFRQGGQVVRAVEDVSFGIAPGEVYGLLGPNGAGKTTTIRMMLGLLPADRGHCVIHGRRSDEHPDEIRRSIGLVNASGGVYPYLTVQETLHYFARIYGLSAAEATGRVRALLADVGLAELADRRAGVLSTGQRQRLHLARALLHDPPVMLLDEPTAGLDIVGSRIVFDFVEQLRGAGKAVLLTTHHLDDAERLCDRFGLIIRGRLAWEGALDAIEAAVGARSLHAMFLALIGDGEDADAADGVAPPEGASR